MSRDAATRLLGVLAGAAFVAAALIGITGGFSTSVGPVRITARDPYRAYYVGVLLGAAALWRVDRARPGVGQRPRGVAPWLVGAISLLTTVLSIKYGAFIAGGADAYGYISEALLWTTGHLHVAEPLTRVSPSLGAAVAPVGFRVASNGFDLVPIYPPGLPLAMALAIKAAGFSAAFFVVPLFAVVAVATTYVIGARVSGTATGLMAAALLACSPIFLLQSMQPMSDVPATALWLGCRRCAGSRPPLVGVSERHRGLGRPHGSTEPRPACRRRRCIGVSLNTASTNTRLVRARRDARTGSGRRDQLASVRVRAHVGVRCERNTVQL